MRAVSFGTAILAFFLGAAAAGAASTIQDTLSACPQASLGFSLEDQAQALVSRPSPTSQDVSNSMALRAKSANIWLSCARNTNDKLLDDAATVEASGNEMLSSMNANVVSAALSHLKSLSKNSSYAVVRQGAAKFAAMGAQLLQALQSQP